MRDLGNSVNIKNKLKRFYFSSWFRMFQQFRECLSKPHFANLKFDFLLIAQVFALLEKQVFNIIRNYKASSVTCSHLINKKSAQWIKNQTFVHIPNRIFFIKFCCHKKFQNKCKAKSLILKEFLVDSQSQKSIKIPWSYHEK